MDHSDARQSMLIPATWMTALKGRRPAEVRTAPPNGIEPCLASSLKGPVPPRRLIAPDTPWGSKSHHGMMFRFQALTITSTSWSSRSPWTTLTALLGPGSWSEVAAMKLSKCPCKHECHDQYPEAQDNHMLRLPQFEPANTGHQNVAHNQIEEPPQDVDHRRRQALAGRRCERALERAARNATHQMRDRVCEEGPAEKVSDIMIPPSRYLILHINAAAALRAAISLLAFSNLRHDPVLFHLLPQVGELGRRFAGRLPSFVWHRSSPVHSIRFLFLPPLDSL